MLIGISSSQGQGKTTVLSSLREYGVSVIPVNTARTILSEWGVTLSDLERDPPLRIQFQDRLIKDHYAALKESSTSVAPVLVERTFSDIFVYTLLSLGAFNEYSEWLDEYYEKCKEYQNVFDKVILLEGRDSTDVESDGVRSTNQHFVTLVQYSIRHYVYEMAREEDGVIHVKTPNHEERIKYILRGIHS